MELGKKIQNIRKNNNLSQSDLAEMLGVSRQSVSKWETGTATPEISKLIQISEMFDISVDMILGTEGDLAIPDESNDTENKSEPSDDGNRNKIVGLIGKTYNSTIMGLIEVSVLLFILVPINIFLYEKGYFGPVTFSFVNQFEIFLKGFLPDAVFIVMLLVFFFRRLLKKDYKYRKVNWVDLVFSGLILTLSIIFPIYFWNQNSYWTSLIILASQVGVLMLLLRVSLLLTYADKKIKLA